MYRQAWTIIGLSIVGLVLRLACASLGDPYDTHSFWLVAEKFAQGHSPYEVTTRYNYGPIWFLVLAALRNILAAFDLNSIHNLHLAIATVLGLTDLGIYLLLAKRFGPYRSLLFYLHPVGILLTGYHSHIDSLALFLGLTGWFCMLDQSRPSRFIWGSILLGLSLSSKHIFFLFPIWIALCPNLSLKKRGISVVLSYGFFALSFLPWVFDASTRCGVIHSVFGYHGVPSQTIFTELAVFISVHFANFSTVGFVFLLLGFGWFWTRVQKPTQSDFPLFALLPIYLIALVAFASAMANQYLFLPLVAVVFFPRSKALLLYSFVSLWILTNSEENIGFFLRITPLKTSASPYYLAQLVLILALFEIWKERNSASLKS